jgi:hypothetical protein
VGRTLSLGCEMLAVVCVGLEAVVVSATYSLCVAMEGVINESIQHKHILLPLASRACSFLKVHLGP